MAPIAAPLILSESSLSWPVVGVEVEVQVVAGVARGADELELGRLVVVRRVERDRRGELGLAVDAGAERVSRPRLAAASAVIFMFSSTWPFFGPDV